MKFSLPKAVLILSIAFIVSSCKEDPQRHLKLGKWYAQKGLVEEAILEFREVTRLYPDSYKELKREDFQALSKAHYNLSLMYTKKRVVELCPTGSRNLFSNAADQRTL